MSSSSGSFFLPLHFAAQSQSARSLHVAIAMDGNGVFVGRSGNSLRRVDIATFDFEPLANAPSFDTTTLGLRYAANGDLVMLQRADNAIDVMHADGTVDRIIDGLGLPNALFIDTSGVLWYSEFTALASKRVPGRVAYGEGGDQFAGATYDPASHYRASAVFDFFREQGLTPSRLRAISQEQVGLLAREFDALDLDPAVITRDRSAPLSEIGGFLALQSPVAGELSRALMARGVYTDSRGNTLRLGPAPYLSERQLVEAMGALGEAVKAREGAGGRG